MPGVQALFALLTLSDCDFELLRSEEENPFEMELDENKLTLHEIEICDLEKNFVIRGDFNICFLFLKNFENFEQYTFCHKQQL